MSCVATAVGCALGEHVAPAPPPALPALKATPAGAPGPYRVGITIEAFQDGCADTNIPYAIAHSSINRFATAFLKAYVAGNSSYLSDLTAGPTPDGTVTVSAK